MQDKIPLYMTIPVSPSPDQNPDETGRGQTEDSAGGERGIIVFEGANF